MARGDITIKILEAVKDAAIDGADLFLAILSAGYGASPKMIEYKMNRVRRNSENQGREVAERIKYRKMLVWLKSGGYIAVESKRKGESVISITKKGLDKLRALTNQRASAPRRDYPQESHSREIVLIFDVPESEKDKRVWLRDALKSLEFTMVQKSVWRGRCKIPKSFLEDVRTMRIAQYIEIFEVASAGTLQ